jgi:hypothetical protein
MMRQEQPKKKRERKKVSDPRLTYEEKAYIKLLLDHTEAWSTIYSPTVKIMFEKKLLEFANEDARGMSFSRVRVSKKGMQLYEDSVKDTD